MSESGVRRLRIGIAGMGRMGRMHLAQLLKRSDVVVAGLADPTLERSPTPEAAVYHDALEMVAQAELDGLIVAVPTSLHHAVAMAALERGLALLVEKPMTASVAEAVELVRLAATSGAYLQVGHVERFNPAFMALHQRFAQGAIGRAYHVRAVRSATSARGDEGVALDLATHDLDLVCQLIGGRPVHAYAELVRANGPGNEFLSGLLTFTEGTVAQVDVNCISPRRDRTLTVLGEQGILHADLLRHSLVQVRRSTEAHPSDAEEAAEPLPVVAADALALQLDAFLAGIRGLATNPCRADDGLWAVHLAALLTESATQRRALEVTSPVAG